MALPVIKLRVYVEPKGDGDPVEHVVVVKHADRLAAEVQLSGLGMQLDLPQHMTTAWAWAALTREGVYSGPLARFMRTDCAGFEVEDDEEATVDPTPPGLLTGSP